LVIFWQIFFQFDLYAGHFFDSSKQVKIHYLGIIWLYRWLNMVFKNAYFGQFFGLIFSIRLIRGSTYTRVYTVINVWTEMINFLEQFWTTVSTETHYRCQPVVNWKHLDFEVQQKYLCSTILEQAWAKSWLRTTYGPPSTLMWPASTFQNLKIDFLDWLNSSFLKNIFLLMLVILARIHRINFKCGLRNKKSCPPQP